MKLLFIENRQKTHFWDAIARRLGVGGHEITWIVQNHRFQPSGGRIHLLPYPKRGLPDVNVDMEALEPAHRPLARVAATDRLVLYHGGTTAHYPHYWQHIGEIFDDEQPDIVFGESTLFHELMVIEHCRAAGTPYLWAGSCRYPPGRFCFYKNDTFDPMGGSGTKIPSDEAAEIIVRITSRELIPDYITKGAQMPGLVRVRPTTVPETLLGYLGGEHFNTPSPLKKWYAMWDQNQRRHQWEALAKQKREKPGATRILYPLQLQPEASLDVHATPYRDQCTVIEMILEAAPPGVQVLVKPNPKSDLEISDRLLAMAAEIPNLVPLPHARTMEEAIADCEMVITVNGTVALESMLSGIPVAVLSSYLHPFLPRLTSLPPENLGEFIKRARAGKVELVTDAEKRSLIQALVRNSYPGVIADPVTYPLCMTPENLQKVANAFSGILASTAPAAARHDWQPAWVPDEAFERIARETGVGAMGPVAPAAPAVVPAAAKAARSEVPGLSPFLSLEWALLAGILTYALMYIAAPIDHVIGISVTAWAFIGACTAALLAGSHLGRLFTPHSVAKGPRAPPLEFSPTFVLAFFVVTALLAIVRILDRLFVRQITAEGSLFDRRDIIESTAGGILSLVTTFTVPACLLALFVYMHLRRGKPLATFMGLGVLLLYFLPAIELTLVASRSVMMVSLFLLLMMLVYFHRLSFRWTTWAAIAAVSFVFLYWSTVSFAERLELMSMPLETSVIYANYSHFVPASEWLLDLLASNETPEWLRLLAFAWAHFTQYYVHGLFEFAHMVDNFGGEFTRTNGANTFFPIFKLVAPLLEVSNPTAYLEDSAARTGIYMTGFGGIFQDFGWFGPIFYLALGFGASLAGERIRYLRRETLVPLYLYLLLVVFFLPVVDLVATAMGLYLIVGFMLFHGIALALSALVPARELPRPVAAT